MLVPCPPSWAEAPCSEQCIGSRGTAAGQEVQPYLSFCCASVQIAWLQEALCHRWAGLGWEGKFILGTFFFFFFILLCLLGCLEKGCKKRSVHGLYGETEPLESWAQILSPAAGGVSLQLFMFQMDETDVSAEQGRGSALLVQVPICICSLWKGEVSASFTGFLSLQFPCPATCGQLQNSAALLRVVQGCSSVPGTLTKCVGSTDARA